MYDTKSRTWDVAYSSGLSLVIGKHTFLFLGLENLRIGVVSITGAGLTASLRTKALMRGSGAAGKIPRQELQKPVDLTETYINHTDYIKDTMDVDSARTGLELLKHLNKNVSRIVAEVPFSFHDIEAAWGSIYGFNVDIMLAGVQKYWIDMSPDVIADDVMYFRDQSVYNLDDGQVGAGLGTMHGKWTVERSYDLWAETSALAQAKLGLEYQAFKTPDIRPNSALPNAIHPFLRDLPILGYPVSPHILSRYFGVKETTP
ncbi:hypothetical protein [Tritonibacter multivorans]|uniref:hypothetical protein n=1 Tax=Tritonibacter multivorans TaxID=928856 RepID=UPI00071D62BC|nr:hypothetical protein [Tritonibacter multivorans]